MPIPTTLLHTVCKYYALLINAQVADSRSNSRLTPSLEVQLVQLYRPAIQDDVLLVTAESVQQQTGANDCGLFSIAFAYNAGRSMDVAQLQVDQQAMREHLRQCFEEENLTPFPLPRRVFRCHK